MAEDREEAALASLVATIAKSAGIAPEAAEVAAQAAIAALAAEGARSSGRRPRVVRDRDREVPAREDTASRPFGTVLACKATKGCNAKLGSVVFGAPYGVASYFECPQCKRRNDFVNDHRGVRWVSPEAFEAFLAGAGSGT